MRLNETKFAQVTDKIMYKLNYFKTGDRLYSRDLKNQRKIEYIDLQQVSSLSCMKKFHLPVSETYKGDYAIVSMKNGDKFFIDKAEHSKLIVALNCDYSLFNLFIVIARYFKKICQVR